MGKNSLPLTSPYAAGGYFVLNLADLAVIPLINPMISMAAGIICPTTISAKKPRKSRQKFHHLLRGHLRLHKR
jgi:hypothetical protein